MVILHCRIPAFSSAPKSIGSKQHFLSTPLSPPCKCLATLRTSLIWFMLQCKLTPPRGSSTIKSTLHMSILVLLFSSSLHVVLGDDGSADDEEREACEDCGIRCVAIVVLLAIFILAAGLTSHPWASCTPSLYSRCPLC